jgi:hypothetical protein
MWVFRSPHGVTTQKTYIEILISTLNLSALSSTTQSRSQTTCWLYKVCLCILSQCRIKLLCFYSMSYLTWNPPHQHAAAVAENELIATRNSRHMLVDGFKVTRHRRHFKNLINTCIVCSSSNMSPFLLRSIQVHYAVLLTNLISTAVILRFHLLSLSSFHFNLKCQ